MSRSATLDPTSMPFRPAGGIGLEDSGISIGIRGMQPPSRFRDQNRSSVSLSGSTLSTSPSEYRSMRSSPSPPSEEPYSLGHNPSISQLRSGLGANSLQQQLDRQSPSIISLDTSMPVISRNTQSPASAQVDAEKTHPSSDAFTGTVTSLSGSLEGSFREDGLETPGPNAVGMRMSNGLPIRRSGSQNLSGYYASSVFGQSQERLSGTPPVGPTASSRSSSFNNPIPFMSTSPASSLDSASQFAPVGEHVFSLERQLRISPFIQDLIQRLARCELATSEIRQDLGQLNEKIDLLLERSSSNGAPEFKDPFAPSSIPSTARGSIGAPIAPNQVLPADDVVQIAQRLNTLTSSVGQLLALQTQQRLHSNNQASIAGPMDIAPNQSGGPPINNPALLGHGLPSRQDPRAARMSNPPIRNWSAGSLDFPPRHGDGAGPLARPDLMRGKPRHSIMGITRRDSAGVSRSNTLVLLLP
jgi:hypothetical protein